MQKAAGSMVLLAWTVARVYFWRTAPRRKVVASSMPPLRRVLLLAVSATLVPVYLYYFTPVLDAFTLPWPAWVAWSGNVGLALATALFVWSHRELGAAWTVAVDVAEGQRIVTSGPYRWVRHPMYSSILLFALALVPATSNLVAAVPFCVAVFAMYAERVRDEERLMFEAFGPSYGEYSAVTGRVLPRIRNIGGGQG